jgi:hypothetical protein
LWLWSMASILLRFEKLAGELDTENQNHAPPQ